MKMMIAVGGGGVKTGHVAKALRAGRKADKRLKKSTTGPAFTAIS
jgi:hypothetical protein